MANLSPNVEFNENDVSQTVPSVTSAVGGIVMHSTKGPVNVRLLLNSVKDLEDVLGRPNDVNYTHWFTAEAFLKASNQLYAVRVENGNKAVAGLTVGISASLSAALWTSTTKATSSFPLSYDVIKEHEAKKNYSLPEGTGGGQIDNATNDLYTTDLYHFYGVGPGSIYEDYSVMIVNKTDFDLLQAFKLELAEATTQTQINTIASKYYSGTPATSSTPAVDYLSTSLVKYDVIIPGTDWSVNSSLLAELTAIENGPTSSDQALLSVFDEFGKAAEQYVFSRLVDDVDGQGNKIFGPSLVNGNSSRIYFFIGNSETAASGITLYSTRKTNLGGADALTGDIVGTSLADLTGEIMTAWTEKFSNTEELQNLDILLDPDYPDAVKRYIDELAKTTRRDCLVVLNVPKSYMLNTSTNRPLSTPYTNMANYVANTLNINSSYSAIYGNYFKIYDRFAEKERWVPASGFCAAIMATVDFTDAQWFAPAGKNRGVISNVIDVAVNPTKAQRDILYYNRINPIIKQQNSGVVIWGQKTMLNSNSSFNRINVRRLFLFLEKTIVQMANDMLFEFNDDFSRSSFRGRINPFLSDVKARRGCYDFLVVCDESNNTPLVIDQNEFRGDILIKATRVAEYIKLTFTSVATGVDFSEVVVK